MRFALTDEQAALADAVGTLLARHAGPDRMRALGGDEPAYDAELDAALDEGEFTTIALEPGAGPLEAALITEAVAEQLGVVAFGTAALVAAAVTGAIPPGPIALTTTEHRGPVRYAGEARTMLVCGDREAMSVQVIPGTYEDVSSRFGYPLGLVASPPTGGSSLGAGSADRVRAWWRVALAVEMAGTMRAALNLTVRHVTDRRQFGRPIGSFQAVQHRLAETKTLVEGAHWLALEAAWLGAPEDAAANAVTYGVTAASRVVAECHQLTGAIGFTTDYDLHLWTMRLPVLVSEARWLGATAA